VERENLRLLDSINALNARRSLTRAPSRCAVPASHEVALQRILVQLCRTVPASKDSDVTLPN
jgi:hypothetical protein